VEINENRKYNRKVDGLKVGALLESPALCPLFTAYSYFRSEKKSTTKLTKEKTERKKTRK